MKILEKRVGNMIIVALCVITVLMEMISISYTSDPFKNRMIHKIIQQACGATAVILLMLKSKIRLLERPKNWLYILPCLVIAIDNFPFYSYFQGNMQFIKTEWLDVGLFALHCLLVGVFEECIFRGVLFSVIASYFTKDKKGFLKTYVVSSVVFGLAHLLNIFGGNVGAVVLQVGYSTLTGGLFAFVLIKTQNVICAGIVHGIYNFCGLLLSEQGLGTGIVFDLGTGLTMALVCTIIGAFILWKVFKTEEKERGALYAKLGLNNKKTA